MKNIGYALLGLLVLGVGALTPTIFRIEFALRSDEDLIEILLHDSFLDYFFESDRTLISYLKNKRPNVYDRWQKLLLLR